METSLGTGNLSGNEKSLGICRGVGRVSFTLNRFLRRPVKGMRGKPEVSGNGLRDDPMEDFSPSRGEFYRARLPSAS